jgi:DNA-binding HxlR family transcriptional regulator
MTSKTSNGFNSKGRRKDKTRSVYNQAIDRTIVEVLSQIERMSNGQLKREVEERCKRTIPPKTWSAHLKTMQSENYLLKDDTLQRNQKVFYSLTEYAKELEDLKLLRTDPKRVAFIQIYANLLFRIIIEGNTYPGNDLENILNEIHANRQELYIDDIKKKFIESHVEKRELTTVPEIPLRVTTTTYYKPTSLGVKIIESTSYRENIFYKNRVEYTTYTYTVPGASVDDLAQMYYTFKPCMPDCESVLELLLQRDIISPIMDFRGKTRYVIADPALTDFVTEFNRYCELENEFLNFKWQYLTHPTSNEEQSRRVFYSDESQSAKFFNVRELQRHQFKQAVKKKNNGEILKLQTKLEEYPHKFEKIRLEYLNHLNEKYRGIINKYHFLPEIIQIISPLLHFIHRNSQTK